MFLRKWKTGQLAIGILVMALLVLGGINVMGLVQGQKAIEEAGARLCALQIYKLHAEAGGRSLIGEPGCPEKGLNCGSVWWE
jgi:hypothetical protein